MVNGEHSHLRFSSQSCPMQGTTQPRDIIGNSPQKSSQVCTTMSRGMQSCVQPPSTLHIYTPHIPGSSKPTITRSLTHEPSDVQYKRVDKLLVKLLEKFPYKALASKVSMAGGQACCWMLL